MTVLPETEKELYARLEFLTRSLSTTEPDEFTTSRLAESILVSRSLASQYLNDLVRLGLVVKVGLHPISYFSKEGLERRVQKRLDRVSYGSLDELTDQGSGEESLGFSKVIGGPLSLSTCIDQLKSAMGYPPSGLPVLLSGATGTGKSFLVERMLEYGISIGVLGTDARVLTIDCSKRDYAGADIRSLLMGTGDEQGWASQAPVGILSFRHSELLPASSLEYLFQDAAAEMEPRGATSGTRLVFQTALPLNDVGISEVVHWVPVSVRLPLLSERTVEERTEFAMRFFKEEGARMGVDVMISQSAFRYLVNADYPRNVGGLRSCITSCCAKAFLEKNGDKVEVKAYQLPAEVLEATKIDRNDDDPFIDMTRGADSRPGDQDVSLLTPVIEEYRKYLAGQRGIEDLEKATTSFLRDYSDHLLFNRGDLDSKASVFNRVLEDVLSELNAAHGMDLTHKSACLISRILYTQTVPSGSLSEWRAANTSELSNLCLTISEAHSFEKGITDQIGTEVANALGLVMDPLSRLLVILVVMDEGCGRSHRGSVGIILSHGYSTASSMADAANRILGTRVFEAIDMFYDQQVEDIVKPLKAFFRRFSYCKEIAILVDTGSLEGVDKYIGDSVPMTIGLTNNASTAMALEVGAGLLAGESLSTILPAAMPLCANKYRILVGADKGAALIVCAEGGEDSASRICDLIVANMGEEVDLAFVPRSFRQLHHNGKKDSLFSTYHVEGIIGTDDPEVSDIPFFPLEDLLSSAPGNGVKDVVAKHMSPEGFAAFQQDLIKNLTLRNVVESITILNPERLLSEVTDSVQKLQRLVGESVDGRLQVGLCVHLCCLVERLVTKTTFDDYGDVKRFEVENPGFITAFRNSFSSISSYYKVDVPIAEIIYVYDYIHPLSRRREVIE